MPGVPEARPIAGIDRPLELVPAMLASNLLDGLGLLSDARRGAMELQEKRRLLFQLRLAISVHRSDCQAHRATRHTRSGRLAESSG